MDVGKPIVFISHASEDRNAVDPLIDLLDGPVEVFCSSSPGFDIPAGVGFFHHIERLLRSSSLIVQLITPAFLRSDYETRLNADAPLVKVSGMSVVGRWAGWRTSRYSAAGRGAACVQAGLSTLWPDGMVTLGTDPRRAPGGPVILRPATEPGRPVTEAVVEDADHGPSGDGPSGSMGAPALRYEPWKGFPAQVHAIDPQPQTSNDALAALSPAPDISRRATAGPGGRTITPDTGQDQAPHHDSPDRTRRSPAAEPVIPSAEVIQSILTGGGGGDLAGSDPGGVAGVEASVPAAVSSAAEAVVEGEGQGEVRVSLEQLERVVGDGTAAGVAAMRSEAGSAGPVLGPEMGEFCFAVIEHIIGAFYGPVITTGPTGQVVGGITSGLTRDDSLIEAGQDARRRFGQPAAAWGRFDDWRTLLTAVRGSEPGTAVVVVNEQPGTGDALDLRHAVAFVHTEDGVFLINPTKPGQDTTITRLDVATATPGRLAEPATLLTTVLGPPVNSRVLGIDPHRRVVTPDWATTLESDPAAWALLDPASPRIGAPGRWQRLDGRLVSVPDYEAPPDYMDVDPPGYSERAPGDCLMYALHDTAFHLLPPEAHTVQGMRNQLADALRDTPAYRDRLRDQARQFLAEDHARALGHQQGTPAWDQAVNTQLATRPEPDWDQIITDLRTLGSWDNAAGDIAPLLAAWVFNLAITVRGPNSTQYLIGDSNGTPIELFRTGTHWLALTADEDGRVNTGWTARAAYDPSPDYAITRNQRLRQDYAINRNQRLRNALRRIVTGDGESRGSINSLFRSLRGVGDDDLLAALGPGYAIEHRNGEVWFFHRPAGAQTQRPAGNTGPTNSPRGDRSDLDSELRRLREDIQRTGGIRRGTLRSDYPSVRYNSDRELLAQLGPGYETELRDSSREGRVMWFVHRPAGAQTQRPAGEDRAAYESDLERLRNELRRIVTGDGRLRGWINVLFPRLRGVGDDDLLAALGPGYAVEHRNGVVWFFHRPAGAQTQRPAGEDRAAYELDLHRLRDELQVTGDGILRGPINVLFRSLRRVGDDDLLAALGPGYAIEHRNGRVRFVHRPAETQTQRPAGEDRAAYESDLQSLRNRLQTSFTGDGMIRGSIDIGYRSLRGVGDSDLLDALGPGYAIENRNGVVWFVRRPTDTGTAPPAGGQRSAGDDRSDLELLRAWLNSASEMDEPTLLNDFRRMRGVTMTPERLGELFARLGPGYQMVTNQHGIRLYRRGSGSGLNLHRYARSRPQVSGWSFENVPRIQALQMRRLREDIPQVESGISRSYIDARYNSLRGMGDSEILALLGPGYVAETRDLETWFVHRPTGSGNGFQVNMVGDVSDAMIRGLGQTIEDTTDPAHRAQLQEALASWTGSPAAATGHQRPAPYIDHDEDGTEWASSSRSGYGPDGQPIPADQKECVEVTVINPR